MTFQKSASCRSLRTALLPQASLRLRPEWPAQLLLSAMLCPAVVWAQTGPVNEAVVPPVKTTWRLSDETWQLPGSETMGMVGGHVMFEVSERWRLGGATYGAVRGERGGFITLGVMAETHQPITPDWSAEAGLFVGGGGGRGGRSLAGGGLMLRSHAGLSYALAPSSRLGFGVSRVSFPSGVIRSTQPYLQFDHSFNSLLANGWSSPVETGLASTSLSAPSRRQEFAVVARSYRIPASVVQDNGAPQHRSMQLLGAEWLSYLDDRWFLKVEAEGAAGGKSAGYMQIFAGGGYRLPLWRGSAIKFHAAGGPAGGGQVDTGGGVLLDSGLAWQQSIGRRTTLELGLARVWSPNRSFTANSLGLKLNHQFALPDAGGPLSAASLANYSTEHLRVRTVNQTYRGTSPNWRVLYPDLDVSNLGVQLDYFVPNPGSKTRIFLTGQGLAAYAGQAGAYMTGLVGAGAQHTLGKRWFVEAETLVGAAGGGGLAMGGGLVVQGNAGIGYRLSPALSLMGTLGQMRALNGDFKARVLGAALAYQFTGWTEN